MPNCPPALSREQSRQIDKIAMEKYGFSGLVLMENAGRNCADEISSLMSSSEKGRAVVIACGPGNNGGDGYVIARHLCIQGFSVKVILACEPSKLQGDAATNYQIIAQMNVPIERIQDGWDKAEIENCCSRVNDNRAAIFVDALLGTGAIGPPRPPLDRLLPIVNQLQLSRIAIDIPSGLDCDTGVPNLPTVEADTTLTFVTSKLGFSNDSAKRHLGDVKIVGIGIPKEIIELAQTTP